MVPGFPIIACIEHVASNREKRRHAIKQYNEHYTSANLIKIKRRSPRNSSHDRLSITKDSNVTKEEHSVCDLSISTRTVIGRLIVEEFARNFKLKYSIKCCSSVSLFLLINFERRSNTCIATLGKPE